MKLLRQSLIVLSFWFLGEIAQSFLGISIPGNVIGMILLFSALYFNLIKSDSIMEISNFLLSHLPFFFIPPVVGLISCLSLLRGNWLEILVITFLSTILVMVSTGVTVQFIQRRINNE